MPRDDLSIDFVKMPQQESADPVQILDDFFYRFQNIPEEIRFIQAEIADKDRQVSECLRLIEDRDTKIQKWIKANGSQAQNPKEETLRSQIRENYAKSERLSDEKLTLSRNLQQLYDRHVLFLDRQIKGLYDRGEPGFNDPDELPSLLRPSAANQTAPLSANPAPHAAASLPATPITTLQNATVPILNRIPTAAIRNVQTQQQAASAPATPAASIILNRQARESSAGPGPVISKRGPRVNSGLANTPTTSSGLARHSSLGPGGPTKATSSTGAGGAVRAGSAGPRAATTKASSLPGVGRKGTPGASGRKKTATAPGTKSSLSRVKKASSKNSPASTAESDLSEAETGSGADESQSEAAAAAAAAAAAGASKRGSQRAASGTPARETHHTKNKDRTKDSKKDGDGDEEMADAEDDEAGDDKKYCLCQNVSFGDMVACDNDDCPYEWFHWTCVGLKSEPNGTWFCPKCRDENGDSKKAK